MDHNLPDELKLIRRKFEDEVEANLKETWNNRKRIIMEIRLLAKWYPENWSEMSEEELYEHFYKRFCTVDRFINSSSGTDPEKGDFEQLLCSRIFANGPINKDFSKEFDEMTKRGTRDNMADEFYKIWIRIILQALFKPEFYIQGTVCIHV